MLGGTVINDTLWKEIIGDCDKNSDDKISF